MKKLGICLLAMLLLAAPVTGAAADGDVSAAGDTYLTASADGGYTSESSTKHEALVDEAKALIRDGQAVESIPAQASVLAKLTFTTNGVETVYNVYIDGESVYYKGEDASVSGAADKLYSLLSRMPGFYKFRPIPEAVFPGETEAKAAITESGYLFKKLDGVFYRTVLDTRQVPTIAATEGVLTLPVITPAPESATVRVLSRGKTVFSGPWADAEKYKPAVGSMMQVQIDATFNGDYYKGTVHYAYNLSPDGLPSIAEERSDSNGNISFDVGGMATYPGEIVVLRASGVPDGQAVTVQSDIDFTPRFYSDGAGGQIALLPVSYFTAAGTHTLQLSSGGTTQKFAITTNKKDFQVQYLTASQATTEQTIASQKANDEFNEKVLSLRWNDSAARLWEGRFLLPVEGAKVTTQFGAIRYTNGSSESSRHGGVDLSVPTGTRVSATNSGKVLFADYVQLTGYTVLIEHGYGLKSWYYHMSAIDVKAEDQVTRGQKIGEVGSTGFSTGPHLHFATSVNNVFVNPYTLINSDLLT